MCCVLNPVVCKSQKDSSSTKEMKLDQRIVSYKKENRFEVNAKNNAYMQKHRAKINSELDVVNKRDNLEVCIRIEYQRNDYCLSN